MNSRIRKTALAAGALLVAAGLTSCIRVDMDIVLEDGRASGEAVLAVSQELMEMAGDQSTEELFQDTDLPEGATVEPYEEDGYVGQRYVFEDAELRELSSDQFAITYDEDAGRYEVTGEMSFEGEGNAGQLPAGLAETFDVTFSVTFPGEIVEHNGELDGQTVTWTPSAGEVAEIHAVAEEGGGGLAWLWIAIAGLALLILLGVLYLLFGRRSSGQAAVPEDATVGAAPGGPVASDGQTKDLTAAAQSASQGTTADSVTQDLSAAAGSASSDVSSGGAADDDRR